MPRDAKGRDFYIATSEKIKAGKTTDADFLRTVDILKNAVKDRTGIARAFGKLTAGCEMPVRPRTPREHGAVRGSTGTRGRSGRQRRTACEPQELPPWGLSGGSKNSRGEGPLPSPCPRITSK